MRYKLNSLSALLPEGAICPARWLSKKGYTRQLLFHYCKNGWMVRVAHGAFRRAGRDPEWQDVVLSLERLWNRKTHVAGLTALEMAGHGFLPSQGRKQRPYAVVNGPGALPGWVKKAKVAVQFARHGLFSEEPAEKTLVPRVLAGLAWPIKVSCPERAVLEALHNVPGRLSFEQASRIMENMALLRPEIVKELLKITRSIKVKRLFLYLAERHRLTWLNRMDRRGVDLGRGNRVLVKNGRFDRKYRITVPRE